MESNGYSDCKLIELTIEMLRGTPNEMFYLSDEYAHRSLDIFITEEPIDHSFSLNFTPKHIASSTRNMLKEFTKLGSSLYLCRLFSQSQSTLMDPLYKSFDENNCGLRYTVSNLMIAADEELCMMCAVNSSDNAKVASFIQANVVKHSFHTLLQLYLYCRHWLLLFQSIVEILQRVCQQLHKGESVPTITCSLLQWYHQHLIRSVLVELPTATMHSSNVLYRGPNKFTPTGRWKPHSNRWFDLFVLLSYESLLCNMLKMLMEQKIDNEKDDLIVFPSFLMEVAATVVATVSDLNAMHYHSTGYHTSQDYINKKNKLIESLKEACQVFHNCHRLSVLPPSLLDSSPLFRYLTTGQAVKKVGLRTIATTTTAAASNTVQRLLVPCVSSDQHSTTPQSFLKERWFNSIVQRRSIEKTSNGIMNNTEITKSVTAGDANILLKDSDPNNVFLLGSFPLKFHTSFGSLLTRDLQVMGKTVAQLINSEHCILQQLRFVRDLYFLGQGSHYFGPVRVLCESLVYGVYDAIKDTNTAAVLSEVDLNHLILTVNRLISDAKPKQHGIESIKLTSSTIKIDEESLLYSNIINTSNKFEELTEQSLLSCLSTLSANLKLNYPLQDILAESTIAKLNKIFRILVQLQLVKWLYEFWWKAGVSSGLLSVIREQIQNDSEFVLRSTTEEIDITVNKLKTNCTVGLNMILRTVSTLLGHFVSSIHFQFAETFESGFDHQHCLIREYSALVEKLVNSVEQEVTEITSLVLELVTLCLFASRHLRSALVLEKQFTTVPHDDVSYFSVVLSYRKAEEGFVKCKTIIGKLKKCVKECGMTDLLYKL